MTRRNHRKNARPTPEQVQAALDAYATKHLPSSFDVVHAERKLVKHYRDRITMTTETACGLPAFKMHLVSSTDFLTAEDTLGTRCPLCYRELTTNNLEG